MRRHALLLLIFLLPLRGWIGDAMAMEMATSLLNPVAGASHRMAADPVRALPAQAEPQMAADTAHAGCAEHEFMADAQDSDSAAALSDCHHATSCQICHAAALAPVQLVIVAANPPSSRPQDSLSDFVSAEHSVDFKPPIL